VGREGAEGVRLDSASEAGTRDGKSLEKAFLGPRRRWRDAGSISK